MSDRIRNAAAVAGPAVVLLLAVWLDTSVIVDAQRQAAATFDSRGVATLLALGSVALAGGCLAVGWLGFRAAPLVGLLYTLVGGFLALLPWLLFAFATQVNDTPAFLPDPIGQAMAEVYARTQGPLNAVGIVGGAMLLAGLAALIRPLRRHDRSGARALAGEGVGQ